MQETHLSASTQAVCPPTGIFFRARIEAARAATALAWATVSPMNLGRGRAAKEEPFAGEVHRAELHVRFEEEAVGIERHAQQLGQLLPVGRAPSSGQDHEVRLQLEIASQRRLAETQPETAVYLQLRRRVRLVADEETPFSRASR